jgi:PAS domain S-box-containing protein
MSNKSTQLRASGIQLLGQIPWGTHFCQFYQGQDDLIDVLVPYFEAGLRNNEYCMWVTADPLNMVDARKAMEAAVPDFVKYEQKGQIEILSYDMWYTKDGVFDHQRVLDGWITKLESALQQGYDGLRLTGNTFWLEKSDWNAFTDYEKAINDIISNYNMIALCTYSLTKCGAIEILDVMSNHQFALIRKAGEWRSIEATDRKRIQKTLHQTSECLRDVQEQFRLIFNNAIEGISRTSVDGQYIVVNPAFAKMFGYESPQDFISNVSNARELYVDPKKRDEFANIMKTRGVVLGFENHARRKDGTTFWILANSQPFVDIEGNHMGYETFYSDITAKKRMEEELIRTHKNLEELVAQKTAQLREINKSLMEKIKEHQDTVEKARQNEELLTRMFDLMPVGIFLTDESGNIVRHNEMAAVIWGGARDVGVNRYIEYKAFWPGTGNIVQPEEWPGSRALRKGITVLNDTIDIVTFDGKRKTILCSAVPIFKAQHEISGSISIIQDITELKQAERIIFQNSLRNEILANIFQKLAEAGLDYQAVLETIAQKVAARIGDASVIRLLSEDGSRLNVVAYHHPDPKAKALLGALHESVITTIDSGIPGKVVSAKKPLLISIVPDDDSIPVTPGYKAYKERFGIHSILAVPLIARGKAIGMIGLSRDKEGNPFTEDDLTILQRIADIAALAIENARFFQENVQSLEKIRYARNLIEASLDPLVTINPEGIITDVNAATVEITGHNRDVLVGSEFANFFTEPDKAREAYKEVFVKGFVKDYSLVIKHASGKLRHVMYNATVYKNESEEIQGVFADARDVTELKQADQQIRRQAMLLDKASEAITLRDLDNRILYWNKGSEKLYGWSAAEVLGRPSHEIIYKGSRSENTTPQYIDALNVVKKTGEWNGEMIHRDRNGNEMVVESRWTLINDESGNPESILVINSDITEKKKLEAQFLRAQRMESIGTLAGGIAHDLNNILTPIMLSLDYFKTQCGGEENQKLFGMLENNIKRASDLVKQVLTFARGVEGERQVVPLKRVITEVERTIRETFPKTIDLQINIAPDLWNVIGDSTQLHQVLMNLCLNARDAMPDGGMLKIGVENFWVDENVARMNLEAKVGSYIVLSVVDSGIGMPPDVINRLFEPFFTTKKLGEGTGLGLSTTRSIVKGHQGFITVYSEQGKGSVFKVYLPAISSKESIKDEKDQIFLLKGNGEHVLVVDDEEPIRSVTISALQSNGYTCIGAGDGSEAIALYVQKQPEIAVVIVDMLMPIMDGYATIHALRKISPRVKIIAVSGISNSNKKFDDSRMVNAFLVKPYTTKKLLETIRAVLSS